MWFVETPWPGLLICLIIAAGLFGQWSLQRRGLQLVACALFLALGGLVVLIEPFIVTPSKQVRGALYGLAGAFERGDAPACSEYFSAHDQTDRDMVRRAAGLVKIDGKIRITDLAIAVTSASSRATSQFRANATASMQGHSQYATTHWEITWQREGNDWKIIHVRRLSFDGKRELQSLSME